VRNIVTPCGEGRVTTRSYEGLVQAGSTFPGRKRIVKSNTESNRVESEGPESAVPHIVAHGRRTFVHGPVAPPFPPRGDTKLTRSQWRDRSSKKITKYGTLLPEFIVRHFAARLVVLVGAAGPVEEGDEEEEEEKDCMTIGGETRENGERTRKERLEN
ncbi:hypothetical protein ALC60_07762, partial [Trachymyrmex zeteki]